MKAEIRSNGVTAIRRRVFEICSRCDDKISYYITVQQTGAWTRRRTRKKQYKYCYLCLSEVWHQERDRLRKMN